MIINPCRHPKAPAREKEVIRISCHPYVTTTGCNYYLKLSLLKLLQSGNKMKKMSRIAYALLLLLMASCMTGHVASPIEEGSVSVFFCDKTNCTHELKSLVYKGNAKCAIYHPSKEVIGFLKPSQLVVDEEHEVKGATMEKGSGLMHNKFCVINHSLVWTGSWNPAQEMTIANNAVVIESKVLSKAFDEEFKELKSGVFHKGGKGSAKTFLNGSLIEAYFCPEDYCEEAVLDVLDDSKSSIDIMVFSFTDDEIGKLIEKKAKEGINVRAVFDPRKDKNSEYERLKEFSKIDKVHHKVFIVDKKIVVTGSYNPTKNGDERNDENVVIIHNENISSLYLNEFENLWAEK